MKGFTLVELLIAATLLLLVLLLAGQVLLESQRMLLRTAAELESGPSELAVALLHSDLQSAGPVAIAPSPWTAAALELHGHPDGRVVWELRDSRLVRVIRDAGGEEVERRVVLQQVASWRWRALLPRLVDVHFGLEQRQAPRGPAILARRPATRTVLREERLRVALRGAGGLAW